MEKDRPRFSGASQHPELFLSIPPWRAGPALAPSAGGCKGGRGAYASGGWRSSFPEAPAIKRVSRGGSSCGIIQAGLCLRGDFHGSPQNTLGPRRQVTSGTLEGAEPRAQGLRALASSMSRESPLPNWVQSYCSESSPGWSPAQSPV